MKHKLIAAVAIGGGMTAALSRLYNNQVRKHPQRDHGGRATGPEPSTPRRQEITLAMLQDPKLWPLRPVLPLTQMVQGKKFLGVIFEGYENFVFRTNFLWIAPDVIRSLQGETSGAVFEAWFRNNKYDSFRTYEEIIDAGWVVD